MRKLILIASVMSAALALSACGGPPPSSNKTKQSQKAAEAAASIDFTENSEIDNIKRRLELTSKPGTLGFVVLLNESGQAVLYSSVKGKITSSGKRLTSPIKEWSIAGNSNALGDAPSDEGTWGSSDPYVYFWDTNGVYHQWSGKYLYSDKPIRLRVEPLAVSGIAAD